MEFAVGTLCTYPYLLSTIFRAKKGLGLRSGVHLCLPDEKNALTIYCWGTDNCKSKCKSKGDFNRHYNTVHLKKKTDCPFDGCFRVGKAGFSRRDNMLQHLREAHGERVPKVKCRFKGSKLVRNVQGEDAAGAVDADR